MQRYILIALFFIVGFRDSQDKVPEEFNIHEIEDSLITLGYALKDIVILKWKEEILDEYKLYIEDAIIFANYKDKFVLVHIYRHPRVKETPPWRISVAAVDSFQKFNNLPTKIDLQEFEKKSRWKDGSGGGMKLINMGICEKNIAKYLQ